MVRASWRGVLSVPIQDEHESVGCPHNLLQTRDDLLTFMTFCSQRIKWYSIFNSGNVWDNKDKICKVVYDDHKWLLPKNFTSAKDPSVIWFKIRPTFFYLLFRYIILDSVTISLFVFLFLIWQIVTIRYYCETGRLAYTILLLLPIYIFTHSRFACFSAVASTGPSKAMGNRSLSFVFVVFFVHIFICICVLIRSCV